MEEHAIPVGHLLLPVLLPLAQRVFLQQSVGLDDELGGGCLKAHTTLDADDGVAHVEVAAYGVGGAYLLNLLDGGNLVVKLLAVDGGYLALLKGNLQFALVGAGHVLEESLFGQALRRVEQLAAADAGSPYTHVVRVLELGEVGIVAVGVEVVHLFLA